MCLHLLPPIPTDPNLVDSDWVSRRSSLLKSRCGPVWVSTVARLTRTRAFEATHHLITAFSLLSFSTRTLTAKVMAQSSGSIENAISISRKHLRLNLSLKRISADTGYRLSLKLAPHWSLRRELSTISDPKGVATEVRVDIRRRRLHELS